MYWVTVDIEILHTILGKGGNLATLTNNAANTTTTDHEGYKTMGKLMQQWSTETGDTLLYFINNADKQRLPYRERIPFTDIMGSTPHHPLLYYSAKAALRSAVWDSEVSCFITMYF